MMQRVSVQLSLEKHLTVGFDAAVSICETCGDAAPILRITGDRALLIDFSEAQPAERSEVSNDDELGSWRRRRVMSLDAAIERAGLPGVVESIVSYASLLVVYEPAEIALEILQHRLAQLAADAVALVPPRRRRWRVPVVYGGEFGPDLEFVASRCGMTADEAVAAHLEPRYEIAMFGFLPGFAYLAGLPSALAVPRRANPRTRVPAGGIGIGGAQTAIGSVAGPSGWHQIGRTPLRMFDVGRQPVVLFDIGDEIEMYAIGGAEFETLARRAEAGEPVAELVGEAR